MVALPGSIVSADFMQRLSRRIHRAKRTIAKDQSLAKAIEFTAAEAKEIAEKGAQDLSQEGLPSEYVSDYRARTEALLMKPLGW